MHKFCRKKKYRKDYNAISTYTIQQLPGFIFLGFFEIYWDFLINPYTFFNKSRTILRVKAKAIVRVRAQTQLRVKVRGQPLTEGARKS
jgi:hypothetical protein